jgi:hypothetical protein
VGSGGAQEAVKKQAPLVALVYEVASSSPPWWRHGHPVAKIHETFETHAFPHRIRREKRAKLVCDCTTRDACQHIQDLLDGRVTEDRKDTSRSLVKLTPLGEELLRARWAAAALRKGCGWVNDPYWKETADARTTGKLAGIAYKNGNIERGSLLHFMRRAGIYVASLIDHEEVATACAEIRLGLLESGSQEVTESALAVVEGAESVLG